MMISMAAVAIVRFAVPMKRWKVETIIAKTKNSFDLIAVMILETNYNSRKMDLCVTLVSTRKFVEYLLIIIWMTFMLWICVRTFSLSALHLLHVCIFYCLMTKCNWTIKCNTIHLAATQNECLHVRPTIFVGVIVCMCLCKFHWQCHFSHFRCLANVNTSNGKRVDASMPCYGCKQIESMAKDRLHCKHIAHLHRIAAVSRQWKRASNWIVMHDDCCEVFCSSGDFQWNQNYIQKKYREQMGKKEPKHVSSKSFPMNNVTQSTWWCKWNFSHCLLKGRTHLKTNS